jgi:uncharacterized protein YegL
MVAVKLKKRDYWKTIIWALPLATWIVGCGNESDFVGGNKTNKPSVADATPQPTPSNMPPPPFKYRSLTWLWQCTNASSTPPAANSQEEPILVGEGTHELSVANLPAELPVMFNGSICPPEDQPRDIIFVVDVSGSMIDNDHITDTNTCGRLDAVDALLQKYAGGNGNIQFAVVTFADVIRYRSPGFFATRDGLYADMKSQSGVLCSHESGGTRYNIALRQAEDIFRAGREHATKEIYFISDGEPEPDYSGISEAEMLKNKGVLIGGMAQTVTIATIMLKGNDSVLENKIASRDAAGKPLHYLVQESEHLADTLANLARTFVTKAEVRYRAVGTEEWTILDALQNRADENDLDFELPAITIKTKEALKGVEAEYEYWNNNNRSFKSGGLLQWKLN